MDQSRIPVSSLSVNEATQHLKDLLNVGNSSFSLIQGNQAVNGHHQLNGHAPSRTHINGQTSLSSSSTNGNVNSKATVDLMNIIQKMSHPSTPATVIPEQRIILRGDDAANSFSVYGEEVDIVASHASGLNQTSAGSNKVKINPVVNFEWEHKKYVGNLVAIHRNCINIAYVLKGKSGGIVRVINRKTAERTLLKGFHGRVLDISFAHQDDVLLGAVDEIGNMFIYAIKEHGEKISSELVLQVNREAGSVPSDFHRLIWCPFIPEEDEGNGEGNDEAARLLVLTHGCVAEMWNIDMVTKAHGRGPLATRDVQHGYLSVKGPPNGHTQPITDASFSPDGTALATASLDGSVKFFQVYLQDNQPARCLHQWLPHDGKPVTSVAFLDDHKNPNPDTQFWKFAVTGCSDNQEFRVWSCESWTCLQTVRFSSASDLPSNFQADPCIQMSMDLSANFMLLSDTKRKVLYVLQFHQDPEANKAHICSISEFLLTQPCLSFAILDASRRRFRRMADSEGGDMVDVTTGDIQVEDEEEEVVKEETGPEVGVLIKMYSIHTRAMQELQIRYKPECSTPQPPPPSSVASISHDGLRDQLSDLSLDTTMSSDVDGLHANLSHTASSIHNSVDNVHSVPKMSSGVDSPRSSRSHSSDHHQEAPVSDRSDPPASKNSSRVSSEFSYQTESSSRDADAKPVLLTPDAFTSRMAGFLSSFDLRGNSSLMCMSSRERTPAAGEAVLSPGSAVMSPTSSHTSSLTAVTGLDEDQLRTPLSHSSSAHMQPSPSSSATLTPLSSKDFSGHPLQTPSPATSHSLSNQGSSVDKPPVTSPPDLKNSLKSESPAITPSESLTSDEVYQETMKKKTMESTESSSSTSLEVSEILEGARQPDGQDDEVEDDDDEEEDEFLEAEDAPDAKPCKDAEKPGTEWPQAPAMGEVNREAHRLASEAIQRAATLHTQQPSQDSSVSQEPLERSSEEDARVEAELLTDRSHKSHVSDSYSHVQSSVSHSVVGVLEQADDDVEIEDEEMEQAPLATSSLAGGDGQNLSAVSIEAVNKIEASMEGVMQLLLQQQKEMEQLRKELREQRAANASIARLQDSMGNLEGLLESKVAGALTKHSHTENQRLHKVLSDKESHEQRKHDTLLASLTHTLEKTLPQRLDNIICTEMRNAVLPGIAHCLEPVKSQIAEEISQKLTATDTLVKENVAKIIRSRQAIDAIGQSVGNAMHGQVQGACRDVLLPGFDRTCGVMFQQMNDTFQKGTHEYLQTLNGHMESVRQRQEAGRDPVISQLQSLVDSFKRREDQREPLYADMHGAAESLKTSTHHMQAIMPQIQESIDNSCARLEQRMLDKLQRIIQQEVHTAVQEQQNTISDSLITAMRSGAMTPAPQTSAPMTPDPQRQQADILALLQQGQLNAAFQQALSASDLSLVMFVCEYVDPQQVFSQAVCPLEQPVLLSLIQQLSAELQNHTALKHRYLEEAVMNLDRSNPITREHMGTILTGLVTKLKVHCAAHPTEKMTKQLRMLLMASQSLLQ